MDYLHLFVFIIFVVYLILTQSFLFGLTTRLLSTITSFLRKLRYILGLDHEEQDFWVWNVLLFFREISRWQYVSIRSWKILKLIRKWTTWFKHVVFCNPGFTLVKSPEKIVEMPKTWFSEFKQTTWFKKRKWFGTFVYIYVPSLKR